MLIKVTQEHINKGCRKDGFSCAVVLAINEILKEGCFSAANYNTICIKEAPYNHDCSIFISDEVRDFIINFDHYYEVKPFEFELDIPQRFLKI